MAIHKKIRALLGIFIFSATALPVQAVARSFTDLPHVLTIMGHSNSAEWDASSGKYVATCDYKSLDGYVPKRGEPCDGSPRITFNTEDLESLKYITQAVDLLEVVRRIYERFPKILVVTSPDFSVDYKDTPYKRDSQVLNLRELLPRGVTVDQYDYLASRTRAVFVANGTGGLYEDADNTVGTVVYPYSNVEPLGGTMDQGERVLPDFSVIFLYKNPDRTTLIHELIHCLIDRAQQRAIVDRSRYIELGQNDGKFSFLSSIFYGENFDESSYPPKELANLDLMFLEFQLESGATIIPGELEVAYFISKYGEELGIPRYAIEDHRNKFWEYVERYREGLLLFSEVIQGYAPNSAVDFINNRSSSYVLGGKEVQGYFRDYWNKLQVIARSYPKNLLGDELRVNRRNPRTIIDHFVVDVGPRSSTTAQR